MARGFLDENGNVTIALLSHSPDDSQLNSGQTIGEKPRNQELPKAIVTGLNLNAPIRNALSAQEDLQWFKETMRELFRWKVMLYGTTGALGDGVQRNRSESPTYKLPADVIQNQETLTKNLSGSTLAKPEADQETKPGRANWLEAQMKMIEALNTLTLTSLDAQRNRAAWESSKPLLEQMQDNFDAWLKRLERDRAEYKPKPKPNPIAITKSVIEQLREAGLVYTAEDIQKLRLEMLG